MPSTRQSDQSTREERLRDELNVVEAIYAEQVSWLERNQEVVYNSDNSNAKLVLRLPDGYLLDALPEVIEATCSNVDLRDRVRSFLAGHDPSVEQLDGIIEEFRCMTETLDDTPAPDQPQHQGTSPDSQAKATVVVWLHHLLNTNKRKQVLSPASSAVAGYSKPGYPGVLLFTGPASLVQAHVQELKSLNWQAFQVRLETAEEWPLSHSGIVEVETLADIVSGLPENLRQGFLSSVMKL